MKALIKSYDPTSNLHVSSRTVDMHPMEAFMTKMKGGPQVLPESDHPGHEFGCRDYTKYPNKKYYPNVDWANEMVVVELDHTEEPVHGMTGVTVVINRNDLNNVLCADLLKTKPDVNPQEIVDWCNECTSDTWGYVFLNDQQVHTVCETLGITYPVPSQH